MKFLLFVNLLFTSFIHGETRPNVILILADDLGWMDTSFTGSTYYQTPNIERLARRGMFFPNAYSASPLCSPTRASILTGQSPARIGITSPACHLKQEVLQVSVKPRARPYEKQRVCTSITRLKRDYYTLAEALKDGGYATGHFGKWHLGHEPYSPLQHGFDVDIPHWPGPGPAGSYVAPWKFPRFKPRTPNEHIEDRMGDEAVAFMKKHKGGPFFLNYWQFSVHAPFDAKEDLIAEYRKRIDPENPQRSPTYAAMVHSLDDNVGKILDALDRLGIADNTIVIFYSDNGGNMYSAVDDNVPTSNAPLRGGKASMYEGGIRVPAIVAWPGVVKGGTRNKALVQSEDLYPTILGMTGVEANTDQAIDGLSMLPALKGEQPLRDAVFCYFPHAPKVPDWLPPCVSVRQGEWKLIRVFHDADGKAHRHELYNLKGDIGERDNLANSMPEKVKALDALIDKFLADTQAVVPQPNSAYSSEAAEIVNDWQAGNGRTRIAFDRKRRFLQVRAFGDAGVIRTAKQLNLPPGKYLYETSMESQAAGDATVSLNAQANEHSRAAAATFKVRHDRHWHNYKTELQCELPITGFDFIPCAQQGTINIKWIRLSDAKGKVVKEWKFDRAPPKRNPKAGVKPQPTIAGWQAGPNGHATCIQRRDSLHMKVTGRDPMLMTARPLKSARGKYSFSIRMKSNATGTGLVFGRPSDRGYKPGSGKTFVVHHDDKWHEYEVELNFDQPLAQIRFDPCTGAGQLEIDWIRLEDSEGLLVGSWDFKEQ